jgi:hypothetical protein
MLLLTLGKMFTGCGWLNNLIAKVIKSSTIIRNLAVFFNYIFEIGVRERQTANGRRQMANGGRRKAKGGRDKLGYRVQGLRERIRVEG